MRARRSKEAPLVDQALELLGRELPGWWHKFHADEYSGRGIPDILGCSRGLFFALEAKAPGKKRTGLTAIQKHTLRKIETAGGVTAAVESLIEVRELIARYRW